MVASRREKQKAESRKLPTMPANSTHADYDAALPGWIRGRDLLAGEDAVKAAGAK